MTDLRDFQRTDSAALRGRRILTLQLARRQATTDSEALRWALAELGAPDTPGDTP